MTQGADRLAKLGESVQPTFPQPSTFDDECSLHPRVMRGPIIVTGAPLGVGLGGQP